MILYTLLSKSLPWGLAKMTDESYATYIRKRDTGYPNFEKWHNGPKWILYQMLHPDPVKRPEVSELLTHPFIKDIQFCKLSSEDHETFIPATNHTHLT